MTNLRVFENARGEILVEVSSEHVKLSRILLVPAVRSLIELGEGSRAEIIKVPFRDDYIYAVFMAVTSRSRKEVGDQYRQIGVLQETDSINILNHIVDILAYP